MSMSARLQIAEIGQSFIQDDSTVLIHGNSRVVSALILKAAESKQFNVIVTEGKPTCDGYNFYQTLFAMIKEKKITHDQFNQVGNCSHL